MHFWSTLDRFIRHTLADLLLPRYCVACGKELYHSEKYICNCCLLKFHPIEWAKTEDNVILRELWDKHDVDMAGSMFRYQKGDNFTNIFAEIKYHGRPEIGLEFAAFGFPYWKDKGLADGVDYIVPVPLHWRRRLHRGYNQAEWIARGIAKVTDLPIKTDILERYRYNKTQTHKQKEDRASSTLDIFRVKKNAGDINHKTILLVDDIITTGSTISDCIRALKEAYPDVKIRIFTLACATTALD